jgi:predicted Zn-dependent peptidase
MKLLTLANGVRIIALPMPHLQTASVSVFVRSGSAHESRRLNGIGHVVEHMVFKGTAQRSSHQINLDAERLGAEANAHTDKDHSAFHLRGLAGHAPQFVAMLADLVQQPTFPADELERERQVLLQEVAEVEDDPMATAYKLFDGACYGLHPLAQPVIGSRANIERFTRDELAAWVAQQYTGANVLVAAAGGIDVNAVVRAAEQAFAGLPQGQAHTVPAAAFAGGLRSRRVAGSSQTHVVLGFPIPALADDDAVADVAAAVLGEGMSSPLMTELRERRGLVYHAACAADVLALGGQFVIEASVAPAKLEELLRALAALLQAQALSTTAIDMERAHNQLAVRRLRALERPGRRLEDAALDWFALGRVRSDAERAARVQAVTAAQVQALFQRLWAGPLALALTGRVGPAALDKARLALGRGAVVAA